MIDRDRFRSELWTNLRFVGAIAAYITGGLCTLAGLFGLALLPAYAVAELAPASPRWHVAGAVANLAWLLVLWAVADAGLRSY